MPEIIKDRNYKEWLIRIKSKFQQSQIKAAISVNTELLSFYWDFGAEIVEQQKDTNWGNKFLVQLSDDLLKEFPDIRGFSQRNIKYIRQWYLFYNQIDIIGQQLVAQLEMSNMKEFVTGIPWGHNISIISKCKDLSEALFYVKSTTEYGWSRSVLVHQIESDLYYRDSKAISSYKVFTKAL